MADEPVTVDAPTASLLSLTADIIAAHVGHNSVATSDLPALIASVYGALSKLGTAPAPESAAAVEASVGAVSVRKSLADPTRIISMIDGKPYALLKRHLSTNGMTPAQYRETYGLKPDYPMVAPAYAEKRRGLAKAIGLGRKPKVVEAPAPEAPPRRRTLKVSTPA